MNSKLKPASSRFKATSTRSKRIPSASRSEEHTSELQSLTNFVCRLLLEKKEHTSELQSLTNLVCRRLLEQKRPRGTAGDRVVFATATLVVCTSTKFSTDCSQCNSNAHTS